MNLSELIVKITADDSELSSGLTDAEGKVDGYSNSTSSKLGGVAKKVGALTLKAVAAAAAGIAAMTKQAVENYSEYEQLTGGVETLFKNSASKVEQYAANAYQTAGMSANEYMETVTSFSASLLQSLDGDTNKAAEKANTAITDMSDNANKMGTSMELIQNAYQGFAKQNYTMLDNLKLGYGGTKEEMERLLSDAEKISGIKYDISSYSDIVDAIHVVQTEMGITGTTASEAATTIEGSINMTKAAWTNLLTGLGDSNADISALVDNLVQAGAQVGENLAPVFEQALISMGTVVEQVAPMISTAIPALIENVLPTMLSAAVSLVSALGQGLVQALPLVLDQAIQLVQTLADGIGKNAPVVIPKMVDLILQLAETIIDNLPTILAAIGTMMAGLATGIVNSIPKVVAKIPVLIAKLASALLTGVVKFSQNGSQWMVALAQAIAGKISNVVSKVREGVQQAVQAVKNKVSDFFSAGSQIIQGLYNGISSKIQWVISMVQGFASKIVAAAKKVLHINSPSKVFYEIGDYCVQGFEEGLEPLGAVLDGNGSIKLSSTNKIADTTTASAISGLDSKLYDAMSAALDNHTIEFNGRELGRMVRSYV